MGNDVLYILGKGSRHNNEELRYSLRSIEKHLTDYDRVIVVGEKPSFISDEVEHYYVADADANKQYRIAWKIIWAISNGIVDGEFLFMNDDVFLIDSCSAMAYPYYSKGELEHRKVNSPYKRALKATYEHLKGKGYTTYDFDHHKPIIYNSDAFMALWDSWEKSKDDVFGFVVKSIYCNTYGITPTFSRDIKFNVFDKDKLEGVTDFSCSDRGWKNGVWDYLRKTFPDKSRFEK